MFTNSRVKPADRHAVTEKQLTSYNSDSQLTVGNPFSSTEHHPGVNIISVFYSIIFNMFNPETRSRERRFRG